MANQALLDTLRTVETPEGIALELRVAGPVVRALAWAVDSLIKYGAVGVGLLVLMTLGVAGRGIGLIALFLAEWFYPVYFEVYRDGATPGKRLYGIKVVTDSGAPLDFAAGLIRNLLRAADFLPLMYGFGLVAMLCSRDCKRLGDFAAGTVVIYRDHARAAPKLPAGPAQAPAVPLSPAEQRLLIQFAERSAQLNPERQAELANLLEPLTAKRDAAAVEQLHAYARWLLGNAA